MAKIKKGFIEADAVSGGDVRLDNNSALRARNQADSADVDILKVNTSDTITLMTSMIPDGTIDIGGSGTELNNVYVAKIFGVDSCGARSIDVTEAQLIDGGATLCLDWNNRFLHDSLGNESLRWGSNHVEVPTNPQGTPAARDLRLWDNQESSARYVALKAPDGLAAAVTLTLPPDDGTSGQVLQTDGSGVMTWATAAAGGDSWSDAVDSNIIPDGQGTRALANDTSDFSSLNVFTINFAGTTNKAIDLITGDLWASAGAPILRFNSGLDMVFDPTSVGFTFQMNSRQIKTLADPTAAQDAATKNYVDNNIVAGASFNKESITLSAGDITNGDVTLAQTPIANTVDLVVSGLVSTEGVDYTVTGAVLDFSAHTPALIAGDVINVKYHY